MKQAIIQGIISGMFQQPDAIHPEAIHAPSGNGESVPAGMDYKAMGHQDGEKIGQARRDAEQVAREIALDHAQKLANAEQRSAWLAGMEEGCRKVGLSEVSARRLKSEFLAIFEAWTLTGVEVDRPEYDDEGHIKKDPKTQKAIIHTVEVNGQEELPKAGAWSDMVNVARQIRKAGGDQGKTTNMSSRVGGTGNSTVRSMSDKKFDDLYEDIANRCTAPQSLRVLDLACTAILARFPFLSEQVQKARLIEDEILLAIKHKAAEERELKNQRGAGNAALADEAARKQANTDALFGGNEKNELPDGEEVARRMNEAGNSANQPHDHEGEQSQQTA